MNLHEILSGENERIVNQLKKMKDDLRSIGDVIISSSKRFKLYESISPELFMHMYAEAASIRKELIQMLNTVNEFEFDKKGNIIIANKPVNFGSNEASEFRDVFSSAFVSIAYMLCDTIRLSMTFTGNKKFAKEFFKKESEMMINFFTSILAHAIQVSATLNLDILNLYKNYDNERNLCFINKKNLSHYVDVILTDPKYYGMQILRIVKYDNDEYCIMLVCKDKKNPDKEYEEVWSPIENGNMLKTVQLFSKNDSFINNIFQAKKYH